MVGGSVALVGGLVTLVRGSVPLVGCLVALVGCFVALVGRSVALVGGSVAGSCKLSALGFHVYFPRAVTLPSGAGSLTSGVIAHRCTDQTLSCLVCAAQRSVPTLPASLRAQ